MVNVMYGFFMRLLCIVMFISSLDYYGFLIIMGIIKVFLLVI